MKMKCKECMYTKFEHNRCYCKNEEALNFYKLGSPLICRSKKGEQKVTIKTSPKWCPLRENPKMKNIDQIKI